MNLGDNLYNYRKKKGISQEELADKLNVSRQTVSLWETGQTFPSTEKLILLSEILDVSLDILCGRLSVNGSGRQTVSVEPFVSPTSIVGNAAQQINDKETQSYDSFNQPPPIDKAIASVKTEIKSYKKNFISFMLNGRKGLKKFGLLYLIPVGVWLLTTLRSLPSFKLDSFLIGLLILMIIPLLLLVFTLFQYYKLRKRIKKLCKGGKTFFNIYFFNNELIVVTENSDYYSSSRYNYSDAFKYEVNKDVVFINFKGKGGLLFNKTQMVGNDELALNNIRFEVHKKQVARVAHAGVYNKKYKIISITLFILSLASLYVALAIYSASLNNADLLTFEFALYTYRFWYALPIPLTSLAFGVYLHKKGVKALKNIIAGVIFSGLILMLGSFWLFESVMFTYDKAYIGEISQIIDFDLPEGKIITSARNESYSFGNKKTIKESRVEYNSDGLSEIIQKNVLWKPKEAAEAYSIKTILPGSSLPSKYDYFMIYVKDANLYNEKPAEEKEYKMIFLGYSVKNNSLYILEYYVDLR